MEAIRPHSIHFAARAVLTVFGAALLWWAPASVFGLVVMLIGLICAVSGIAASDMFQSTTDSSSGPPISTTLHSTGTTLQ